MGCCEDTNKADASDKSSLTVAIAGNPNCGKSALFNAFTGIRQKTGNWPGVTVDRKQGFFELQNRTVTIYDLPGIYSLDASSIDEEVTRDYLLSREANLIINVVDAANLERNLYLTTQLLEMGVPIVLVLNMMDVARKRGIDIDTKKPILADTTGGLSGPVIKPIGVRMVWECYKCVCKDANIPIVGMGGISNYEDAIEYILAGATAIAVGTTNFYNPDVIKDIIQGIESYLQKEEIDDVKKLVGSLQT